MASSACPCGSGKEYEHCCKSFHHGRLAENALELMRSRYSAYVLNIPDYIIATTHFECPEYEQDKFSWKRSISRFSRGSTFQKLEILDFQEKKTWATVTFTVYLSQGGHDGTFTERSYFEKIQNRWFYRGGQLEKGHAPNLVTTGQLRLLPLAYYGDPILRMKSEPIEEITSDIRKLVEEMIETMDACNGIGLAAPQVHHSIRLLVIKTPLETHQDIPASGEIQVLINPILTMPSKETWKEQEGCLSIPPLRAMVERPREVSVTYKSLDGTTMQQRFSGWPARVLMHENDHLDGILFIDRLDSKDRLKIDPFLKELEKSMHDGKAL